METLNKTINSRIILEGPNGVGKTSVAKLLSEKLKTKLYSPFSNRIDIYELWFKEPKKALDLSIDILKRMPKRGIFDRFHLTPQTMINHPLLFLPLVSDIDVTVLLDANIETLKKRLIMKGIPDDVDSEGYYRPHYIRLADSWNAIYINTDKKSIEEISDLILERYSKVINSEKHLIKEGKSKKIYRHGERLIITLKPSLDSYTHDRSQIIVGTDCLRNLFFEKAIKILQLNKIPVIDYHKEGIATYSCEYCYTVPFECIVKRRATGTTLTDCPGLFYPNMPFLYPVIRFDYRTEPRDIPIPKDYLENFGIHPKIIEDIAYNAFITLERWLTSSGYELFDICFVFGFSKDGNIKIISEISPDGMRVRKMGESYDKDLFRKGATSDEIIRKWTKLIDDLN